MTIGSGGSGGIFSPSLFLGAVLGGGCGLWMSLWLPVSPVSCAIAGMAAMVAGTTGGVLMAVVMVLEMTQHYSAILPCMLCAGTAAWVRQLGLADSIYTLKLQRRGVSIPIELRKVSPQPEK